MLGHQQWAGGERGPLGPRCTKGRETALGLTPDGSGPNPGSERPGDFSTGRKSDLVGKLSQLKSPENAHGQISTLAKGS